MLSCTALIRDARSKPQEFVTEMMYVVSFLVDVHVYLSAVITASVLQDY